MFLSLLALACSLGMSALQMSTIRGKFNFDTYIKQMYIYEVENCECKQLASSNVDKNGNFAFSIFPEKEGFYVVGTNPKSEMNRYIFYLKPGDNVSFIATQDDYQMVGKSSKENLEMEKWHKAIHPVEAKAVYWTTNRSTYKEFFPEFSILLPSLQKYPKAKTGNKTFDAAFEDFKKFNICDYAMMYIFTPRTAHPKTADFIDFYKNMDGTDYTKTPALLNYPNGLMILGNMEMTKPRTNPSLSQEEVTQISRNYKENVLNAIVDPTVKGEYVLSNATSIKTYPGIIAYNESKGKYLVNDGQRTRMQQIIDKLDKNEAGNLAAPFKLPDTTGKMHALSDYRGKLVYIDFWATWCGPCKGEIPYMTKLEEEYADNPDIVFISVSTDKEANKQKWLDMVKEKGMKGIQLFTGNLKEQVSEPFHINTIPRFVLIGRDGKLINGDAPRPSSEEIRPLINYHLKKK